MAQYRIRVRNRDFRFLGEVDKFISLQIVMRMNEVSTWVLEIDAESAAASYFRENAANPNDGGRGGIYVERNGFFLLSGPTGTIREIVTDDGAILQVSGTCDLYWIAKHLAMPHPRTWSSPYMTIDGTSSGGHSDYIPNKGSTGSLPASYHIYTAVRFNIGESAPTQRPPLPFLETRNNQVGALLNPSAGEYLIARGENLFELCKSVADFSDYRGSPIRMTAYQYDTGTTTVDGLPIYRVRFESLASQFRPNVIFSPDLGTMGNYTYERIPPQANRILMGGSGEGRSRRFAHGQDEASVAAYGQIEMFAEYTGVNSADGSSTWTEERGKLLQEIDALLAENAEQTAFSFDFRETPQIQYGRDFELGDRVTIRIRGAETQQLVRGVTFNVSGTEENMEVMAGTGYITKGLRLFDQFKWLKHRYSDLTKRTIGQ
jgi:hypothetical protein